MLLNYQKLAEVAQEIYSALKSNKVLLAKGVCTINQSRDERNDHTDGDRMSPCCRKETLGVSVAGAKKSQSALIIESPPPKL